MTTMYNQQPGYAQAGYPPQGFNPPQGFPPPGFPHAGGGFYAQYNAYDPAAFHTFYREQLRQLVQNSRPVIQQLTQLAIENLGRMGHVVAESIAEYIHNVSNLSSRCFVGRARRTRCRSPAPDIARSVSLAVQVL